MYIITLVTLISVHRMLFAIISTDLLLYIVIINIILLLCLIMTCTLYTSQRSNETSTCKY